MKTLPDCICQPGTVGQMQPGDNGNVSLDRLFASFSGTAYLSEHAKLGMGPVGVCKTCDGYQIDLSKLPEGSRVERKEGWFFRAVDVVRVDCVQGAIC